MRTYNKNVRARGQEKEGRAVCGWRAQLQRTKATMSTHAVFGIDDVRMHSSEVSPRITTSRSVCDV